MRPQIYLDYNATQPLKPAARDAMLDVLDAPSNASSIHSFGRRARRRLDEARACVAGMIGAEPSEIVFTSGATEANTLALRGIRAERRLVSAVEHPSVRDTCLEAATIPVDARGVVDLAALERMLAEAASPALVSIMLVNNETGVIQPVAEAARIAHARGAALHCDAAQAPGRIAVDVHSLGVDLMTLSSHKLGGPQGAGALYIRDGIAIAPLLVGGGQEKRRRSGTENVAAIAGFGIAARLAVEDLARAGAIASLRDRLETVVTATAPEAQIHGSGAVRVCNTSCFGVPGLSAETVLIALDLAGIAVSSGAACSSGAVEPSQVLRAMGLADAQAREAIRVSLGWATRPDDIERLVEAWTIVYRRSRAAPAA